MTKDEKIHDEIINRVCKTDEDYIKMADDLAAHDEKIVLAGNPKYDTSWTVADLKKEAKMKGLSNYSKLKERELIQLLNDHNGR